MKLSLETWKCLRYRLLILYDGLVGQSPGAMHRVNSPNYTVWLVRDGEAVLHGARGVKHIVPLAHWVCIPPSYERQQLFLRGTEVLSAHFTAAWPTGNDILHIKGPVVVPYSRWKALERALRGLLTMQCSSGTPVELETFVARESAMIAFLASWYCLLCEEGALATGPRDLDPRLARAIAVIDRSGYAGSVPYDELCDTCNLSRVQIDRLFRSSIGKSPRGYMEERVLERVIVGLVDPAQSIKELCLDQGFASTSHFNQWFRKLMDMTPGAYRQRLQRQRAEPGNSRIRKSR